MQLDVNTALIRMREYSEANIPFSIEYYTYSSTDSTGGVLKKATNIMLKKGMREDKSEKAKILLSYEELSTGKRRHFNLPLLMKLNNTNISL